MKKVSALLVEHLKKFGVQHIFGIPGKAVVPLNFEIGKQGMNYVLCRHEAGAGFAAGGYALMRKTLGVVVVTGGPGGTNLLTAAGAAKAFHLPLLFITGHPSFGQTGRALGHDASFFGTDLVKIFEPLTLFSARVECGNVFPLYFQHALEKAWSGLIKGPVHLNIPADVLDEEIEPFEFELSSAAPLTSSAVEQVIPVLNEAQSPVIFLGKGVHLSGAYEEVMQLASRWNIPVMTTPGGKGCFPTDHALSLGGFGLGGSKDAEFWLRKGVDLMIVIGSKLSDLATVGLTPNLYPKRIIQFDCDPTFIGKTIPVPTLAVIGDAKHNLRKLLICAESWHLPVPRDRDILRNQEIETTLQSGMLSAATAMRIIRQCLPHNTIFFGDNGSHTFYAIKYLDIYEPGTFYFDEYFATMGHAIGYSIGIKMALPSRPVVCITGDGCMMMHGTEISTAVCNKVPVIFIVINNGRLDMVDKGMTRMVGCAVGTIFENTLDAAMFGRSLGATAFCCRNESELANALQKALTSKGPVVIEVMVDPEEIPPILKRGD